MCRKHKLVLRWHSEVQVLKTAEAYVFLTIFVNILSIIYSIEIKLLVTPWAEKNAAE